MRCAACLRCAGGKSGLPIRPNALQSGTSKPSTRAFSSEVGTGSREENAPNKEASGRVRPAKRENSPMHPMTSEVRDGMRIHWDAPIPMEDGVTLRADVFRPTTDGAYPLILSYGPYAKGLSFQEKYKANWTRLINAAPEVLEGSSNKYQNWDLVDPEKWVPDGYICMRVDSRGAGRSPGVLDIWSAREAQDLYE